MPRRNSHVWWILVLLATSGGLTPFALAGQTITEHTVMFIDCRSSAKTGVSLVSTPKNLTVRTHVECGEQVTITKVGKTPDWYEVRTDDGRTGYIPGDLLKSTPPASRFPPRAQGAGQPFVQAYSNVTTEQAWNAAAAAARDVQDTASHIIAMVYEGKIEFEQHVGRKAVGFRVSIARAADGQAEITAVPYQINGHGLADENYINSVAENFFAFADKEVENCLTDARNSVLSARFSAVRRSLIGKNAIARTALPVWLEPNGETTFPAAFSRATPGNSLTITNIVLCTQYPAKVESECSTQAVVDRNIMVLLFNGAQPRLLPSPRPVQLSNTGASFGDILDSFVCAFGSAISCVQANEQMNTRELQRLRGSAFAGRSDAGRASAETSHPAGDSSNPAHRECHSR